MPYPTTLPYPDQDGPFPLVKFLVTSGVGSRRIAADLIIKKKITVNGILIDNLKFPINSGDRVVIGGKEINFKKWTPYYFALHKPVGYLTTVQDDRGRPTVMDLVPPPNRVPGLVPVGRLDFGTSGLLLLTNDGDLAYRLTHPRFRVEKEYVVTIDRGLSLIDRRKLTSGISILGRLAYAVSVKPIAGMNKPRHFNSSAHRSAAGATMSYSVILTEGQNREIRNMFQELGYRVLSLKRIRMGPIRLRDQPPGNVRILTKTEIKQLQSAGR